MSPTLRWPSSTWCPPYQRMPDEPERRQQVDLRHEVGAQLAPARSSGRRRSRPRPHRRSRCRRSAPKPFTTRMPVTLSSTTPERSESSCCERRPTGIHPPAEPGRREVEQRQRGRARRTRGPGCCMNRITATGDHLDRARDRERDQQHDVVDLLDVGVRVGHELAGLRAVVEREVQRLEMGDEPHPHVALDAHRETERRVTPDAGTDRLDRADPEDQQRPVACRRPVAVGDAVVDGGAGERRAPPRVRRRPPRPATMPPTSSSRCAPTFSRMSRQPAFRLARSSSTESLAGCDTRTLARLRGHEAATAGTRLREATSGSLTERQCFPTGTDGYFAVPSRDGDASRPRGAHR